MGVKAPLTISRGMPGNWFWRCRLHYPHGRWSIADTWEQALALSFQLCTIHTPLEKL